MLVSEWPEDPKSKGKAVAQSDSDNDSDAGTSKPKPKPRAAKRITTLFDAEFYRIIL
jgi:hypothetical protein